MHKWKVDDEFGQPQLPDNFVLAINLSQANKVLGKLRTGKSGFQDLHKTRVAFKLDTNQ